ncbi:MAG: hypothetical protein ACYSTL_01155, partial [Planctomycetota bacterium]
MNFRIAVIGLVFALIAIALPVNAIADENQDDDMPTKMGIAEAIAPSLLVVEYTFQYDKGEGPPEEYEKYIKMERPNERKGFLVGPTEVVTGDTEIQQRFIKSIRVRFGDNVVDATPAGWATDRGALFLKLASPLEGAKPLVFCPDAKGPYYLITYDTQSTVWTAKVGKHTTTLADQASGHQYIPTAWYSLLVDEKAAPVGLCMKNEVDADDSWKGSPLDWPLVTVEKMDSLLEKLEQTVRSGILHVTLNFRSPKKQDTLLESMRYGRRQGADDTQTELHVPGLLIAPQRIAILANLRPKVTARLDRIDVRLPDGKKVNAKFERTLVDYGCLLATFDEPLNGSLKLSSRDVRDVRHHLLMAAEMRLHGEKRTDYYMH